MAGKGDTSLLKSPPAFLECPPADNKMIESLSEDASGTSTRTGLKTHKEMHEEGGKTTEEGVLWHGQDGTTPLD